MSKITGRFKKKIADRSKRIPLTKIKRNEKKLTVGNCSGLNK